ncbi:unnamed protein product [Vitrella brassicaformis CCMP3155]|uniref:Lysophospholipid acyltransferase 7 n=1 Tax=Vitrella brassicaformis (strain CCMP3155) TaxID=1169540 RepID=A0A0G4FKU0_VITBC|nr:unnamed protein product [Vitrella brassicaformis CCMP3155]|eukprot:CEM13983.1 unnamed protein product [Vitrella brassicaformis CCMP3155]
MLHSAPYPVVIFASLFLSSLLPLCEGGLTRSFFSTGIGLLLFLWIWGDLLWFAFVLLAGSYVITQALHRTKYCGLVGTSFSFILANLLRVAAHHNWAKVTLSADLCLYMLALRVSTVAWHAQDHKQVPRFLDVVHFIFFFPGMSTGPNLSYESVQKALTDPNTHKSNPMLFIWRRVKETIFHLTAFMLFMTFVDEAKEVISTSEEFQQWPFLQRFAYIHFFCFMRRAQIGFVWFIAECTCALSGLGYREDVTDRSGAKIDEDVIKAWDPALELATSTKLKVRMWNCSVQTWLAINVYKRLPSKMPKMVRRVVALSVSAFWHGVDPGLYISFVLYPFFELAEGTLTDLKWPGEDNPTIALVYRAVRIVIATLTMDFALVPFQLLTFEASWRAWKALHFYGFGVAAVFFVTGKAIRRNIRHLKKRRTAEMLEVPPSKLKAQEPVFLAPSGGPPLSEDPTFSPEVLEDSDVNGSGSAKQRRRGNKDMSDKANRDKGD